jgi:hypothetical protein
MGMNSVQNHVDAPSRNDLAAAAVGGEPTPEVKTEPGSSGMDPPPPAEATMQAIMAFLRKNNLLDTEAKLRDELKKREVSSISSGGGGGGNVAASSRPSVAAATGADNEVGNVLASYKSEGDPSSYESAYK